MRKSILAMLAVAGLAYSSAAEAGAWVYVGSWEVGDGPYWGDNPPAYTGQQAAALLFGGTPGNYAISTAGSDVADITHTAWYSVLGAFGPNDGGYEFAEDYVSANSSQSGGLYNSGDPFPMSETDVASAYVQDNAGDGNTNFAFAWREVPEPMSLAIFGLGLAGLGAVRRLRAA